MSGNITITLVAIELEQRAHAKISPARSMAEKRDDQEMAEHHPKTGILRSKLDRGRRKAERDTFSGTFAESQTQKKSKGSDIAHINVNIAQLPSVKWALPSTADQNDDRKLGTADEQSNDTVKQHTSKFLKREQQTFASERFSPTAGHASSTPQGSDCQDECFVYNTINAPLSLPDSEDEDYSLSVSAVMQRRASTKGGNRRKGSYISPRRTSSPIAYTMPATTHATAGGSVVPVKRIFASNDGVPHRRRSSVFTTSSGEAAPSLGDGTTCHDSTKEQIFENIRLHKEVLQSVKMQPWSMRRKLRLVRQAKEYVARHEGALHERFATSGSTRDLWARFKILLASRWQHTKREIANLSTVIVPWQLRIKEIESHFGSVVASYFTFLRWLLWVNIVIAFALTVFVIAPEFLATQWPPKKEDLRKNMLPAELANATRLISIWDFEGFLKYSPLFYGYYSDFSGAVRWHYDLPLAYFLTGLVVYIYSFWATLRKMAENSRMSKMSSKDDECVFSWKLFTGWDYMIGHAETAHNRTASVVLGFKEALLEEAEKKKDKRNWKIIVMRGLVNLVVLHLLAVSAFAVVSVVNRSTQEGARDSYWRRNEITIVITAISNLFPMCFEFLGFLEIYHPRKQLRMQLARIMALNLLNLYTLIIALFDKIGTMNKILTNLHENITLLRDLQEADSWSSAVPTHIDLVEQGALKSITEVAALLYSTTTAVVSDSTKVITDAEFPTFTDWYDPTTNAMTESILETVTECVRTLVNCSQPILTDLNRTAIVASVLLYSGMLDNVSFNNNSTNISEPFRDFEQLDEVQLTTLYPTNTSNITDLENYELNDAYESFDRKIREVFEKLNITESELSDALEQIQTNNNTLNVSTEAALNFTASLFSLVDKTTDLTSTGDTQLLGDLMDLVLNNIQNVPECYEYVCSDVVSTETSVTEATLLDNSTTIVDEYSKVSEDMVEPTIYVEPKSDRDISTENILSNSFEITTPDSIICSEDPAEVVSTINSIASINETNHPHEHVSITKFIMSMDAEEQLVLRKLCWETMFGQELVKLTVMDLVATIGSTIFMDFFRALFVRFLNKFWCWNLEKRFPKYGDFKIAENILHLVNNQGQVWMGMFFSPGLAILNLLKLVIIMYLRSWAVLTCNVPHEVVFRASRSNNFYLALLLTMLFLCVLPVGYAIVWINPSWHCGPFSKNKRIYHKFTNSLRSVLPKQLHPYIDYFASPSTVIPLLLLLILIIYYLVSLTGALREANQDLRQQLRRERTEGRKKMLRLPKQEEENDNMTGNVMERWRKVLEASSPVSPSAGGTLACAPGQQIERDEQLKNTARKELVARIMKKALRKGSNTSDDDSQPGIVGDDETDTEQHESLPHDMEPSRPTLPFKRPLANIHRNSTTEDTLTPIPTPKLDRISVPTPRLEKIDLRSSKNLTAKSNNRFKVEIVPEDEKDISSRVVRERRRSLLRQKKLPNLSNLEVNTDEKPCSYEVINEKLPNASSEPAESDVFSCDAPDVSDDDNTSYRDMCTSDQNNSISNIAVQSSSNEISSPKNNTLQGKNISTTVDTVQDVSGKIEEDIIKPKRRFNSFLTLVREVVTIKKQEDNENNLTSQPADNSKCTDVKQRNRRRSSVALRQQSLKRNSRGNLPVNRQDSQTSNWSENIPVITISKTGSDECILEDRERSTASKEAPTSDKKNISSTSNNFDKQAD